MGNYNPNKPNILGFEWVPLTGDPVSIDTETEYGYSFPVTGLPFNNLIQFMSSYLSPASSIAGQTVLFSVYPQGREDDTGEIRTTRVSLQTVFVTGAVVSGTDGASALRNPSDGAFIVFNSSTNRIRATTTNVDLSVIPSDARILGVDLVYQAAGTPGFALEPTLESNTVVYPYGPYITGPASLQQVGEISTIRFGEVDPWWSVTGGPDTVTERIPWRPASLARWSTAGTGGQLFLGIRVNTLPLSGFVRLGYLAFDIHWCIESRVAYGGNAYGQDPNGLLAFRSVTSLSETVARDPTTLAQSITLPAGNYTVTTTMADAGDKFNAGDHIKIPLMYQYAPVRSHPAVQVTKFRRPSGILPAIGPMASNTNFMQAVHMSSTLSSNPELQGGAASFVYNGLEAAPIWLTPAGTSVFATQQIHNEASPSDTSYEWVRYYARRFNPSGAGDLTVTVSGSGSATITAAEFAALPELVVSNPPGSGWKEVTLPITAVFGSDASFRNVTFTMTGVATSTALDQYQIMVPRNIITDKYKTPKTTNAFSAESSYDGVNLAQLTYVAPESGSSTVPAASNRATAVVMFSQSLAAPTGTAAALTSMPVSGIGRDCGVPMCIPTSIYANQLTWSPIAVTGAFNYYEIQRSDSLTDWQSIAYVTGHHSTSFTDWEARVGVQSDYRIRSVNVSRFAGPWSSTFSNTLTTPGAGGVGTGNSLLIFTSNFGPTGNLAYIMQWEGEPVQDFVFPEAGFVSLQTQYQRDYFTAHHPTERGGVQFSRTMLIQAAAIPVGTLSGFTGLRDLAWASRPYVCVRDQRGNRWFAIVQVPAGVVRSNNTAYLAEITVTQSTDTAAPVTVP